MLVWAGGKYALGLAAPYLLGLLAALVGYVGAALIAEPAPVTSVNQVRPAAAEHCLLTHAAARRSRAAMCLDPSTCHCCAPM